MRTSIDFANSAIVVAHPDDEVLWFASIVLKVARIVVCYGAISPNSTRAEKRRGLMRHYPLDTLQFLDLPIPHAGLPDDAERTAKDLLAERLSGPLDGIDRVFTHNPWGEYGHADHRRVHAVVAAPPASADRSVFVSTYTARHQLPELERVLARGVGETIALPVDRRAIEPIVALYKARDCWTWAPFWRWPRREHFFCLEVSDMPVHEVPALLFGTRNKPHAEMRSLLRRLLPMRPRERSVAKRGHLS